MKFYKVVFILFGFIFMAIGMIGVVVPVLPTTPFLIIASILFAKGSEKFELWFKNTNLYKNYAEDFINERSMTLKRKIFLMMFSDLMLAFPLIILDNRYIRIFIMSVIFFKYYYFIFRIRTKKE